MPGIEQFENHAFFIPTGGFENDQAGTGFGQFLQQLRVPGFIVGKAFCERRGPVGDVKLVFGNVDSDKRCEFHFGGIPSLQIRAGGTGVPSALAAVRA